MKRLVFALALLALLTLPTGAAFARHGRSVRAYRAYAPIHTHYRARAVYVPRPRVYVGYPGRGIHHYSRYAVPRASYYYGAPSISVRYGGFYGGFGGYPYGGYVGYGGYGGYGGYCY